MMDPIAAYTEGPTEWYVVHQLEKRGILHGGTLLKDESDERDAGRWIVQCDSLITKKHRGPLVNPPTTKLLLLYDQEKMDNPVNIADRISKVVQDRLGEKLAWEKVRQYPNVFLCRFDSLTIALHVATAKSPDGNRDFDGYVMELLDRIGPQAVTKWFNEFTPHYLRSHCETNSVDAPLVHKLGRDEIPGLMNKHGWGILRAKGLLYAYITALQANRSHVWFAEKIVKIAPEETLIQVFAPLIAAWDSFVGKEAAQ